MKRKNSLQVLHNTPLSRQTPTVGIWPSSALMWIDEEGKFGHHEVCRRSRFLTGPPMRSSQTEVHEDRPGRQKENCGRLVTHHMQSSSRLLEGLGQRRRRRPSSGDHAGGLRQRLWGETKQIFCTAMQNKMTQTWTTVEKVSKTNLCLESNGIQEKVKVQRSADLNALPPPATNRKVTRWVKGEDVCCKLHF